MSHFDEFLNTWRLWSNSVTRQDNFDCTKISGKCQNSSTTFSLRSIRKTNLKQISKGDKVSQLEEDKNKYEVYEKIIPPNWKVFTSKRTWTRFILRVQTSGILATKSPFFLSCWPLISGLVEVQDLYLMWTKKSFVASTEKEPFFHTWRWNEAMSLPIYFG